MPDPSPLAFGRRVRLLRTRRGMTREVLAGLLGMSVGRVKKIENDTKKVPSADMVLMIAEALRFRVLSDLIGGSRRIELFVGTARPRLAEVAAAVNRLPLEADREARSSARIFAKTGARDRAQAVRYVYRAGPAE